jgi:hypothetical protein
MPPQTPVLLLDNFADTVTQYPNATVTADSVRVGYEEDHLADYRRERTSWQSTASSAHTLTIDLGTGVTRTPDSVFLDRGHNFAGLAITLEYSDNGSSWTTVFTRSLPAAGTLGGDPTSVWCITEEGAAYTFFSTTAHRYWRLTVASGVTFVAVLPGLIIGARTQLLGFSRTFDEDAAERTQSSATSTAGYRGTDKTYSWRTLDLDLTYIGDGEYSTTIRTARALLFDKNEPAVIIMDYGTRPERAWMYQYDGTTWAMPKSRVYRAGRMRFREVGASLS